MKKITLILVALVVMTFAINFNLKSALAFGSVEDKYYLDAETFIVDWNDEDIKSDIKEIILETAPNQVVKRAYLVVYSWDKIASEPLLESSFDWISDYPLDHVDRARFFPGHGLKHRFRLIDEQNNEYLTDEFYIYHNSEDKGDECITVTSHSPNEIVGLPLVIEGKVRNTSKCITNNNLGEAQLSYMNGMWAYDLKLRGEINRYDFSSNTLLNIEKENDDYVYFSAIFNKPSDFSGQDWVRNSAVFSVKFTLGNDNEYLFPIILDNKKQGNSINQFQTRKDVNNNNEQDEENDDSEPQVQGLDKQVEFEDPAQSDDDNEEYNDEDVIEEEEDDQDDEQESTQTTNLSPELVELIKTLIILGVIPEENVAQLSTAFGIDLEGESSMTTVSFTRNLTVGSTGPDVKRLQQILNQKGFTVSQSGEGSPGNESNYFGPATRSALIRYQRANNISPASGYFGPLTRNLVN